MSRSADYLESVWWRRVRSTFLRNTSHGAGRDAWSTSSVPAPHLIPGAFEASLPRSAAYIRLRCTRGSWASMATPLCCFSAPHQSPVSHSTSSLGRLASICRRSGWQRLPRQCELPHIEYANSRARRGTQSDLRSRLWCATSFEITAVSFQFRSASPIGFAPVCPVCSVPRVRASHFAPGWTSRRPLPGSEALRCYGKL